MREEVRTAHGVYYIYNASTRRCTRRCGYAVRGTPRATHICVAVYAQRRILYTIMVWVGGAVALAVAPLALLYTPCMLMTMMQLTDATDACMDDNEATCMACWR